MKKKYLIFAVIFLFLFEASYSEVKLSPEKDELEFNRLRAQDINLIEENINTTNLIKKKLSMIEREYFETLKPELKTNLELEINVLKALVTIIEKNNEKVLNSIDPEKKEMIIEKDKIEKDKKIELEKSNNEAFNNFLESLKNKKYFIEKISDIKLYSENNGLKSLELSILINLFDKFEEKYDLLKMCYSKLSDKENIRSIFKNFKIKSEVDKINDLIYIYEICHARGEEKISLNNQKFNILKENLENAFSFKEKYAFVKLEALNYLFTIDQLNETLEFFSFDTEKIEIIKIVYPNIYKKGEGIEIKDFTYFNKERIKQIIELVDEYKED